MAGNAKLTRPLDQLRYHGVGGRKTSVARVWMTPGNGNVTINDRQLDDYFCRDKHRVTVKQPLELTGLTTQFDVDVNVTGGGVTGQAEAIRHGLTKALIEYNEELRTELRRAGWVTRDARIKERKKYGQKGARAQYQFSKR